MTDHGVIDTVVTGLDADEPDDIQLAVEAALGELRDKMTELAWNEERWDLAAHVLREVAAIARKQYSADKATKPSVDAVVAAARVKLSSNDDHLAMLATLEKLVNFPDTAKNPVAWIIGIVRGELKQRRRHRVRKAVWARYKSQWYKRGRWRPAWLAAMVVEPWLVAAILLWFTPLRYFSHGPWWLRPWFLVTNVVALARLTLELPWWQVEEHYHWIGVPASWLPWFHAAGKVTSLVTLALVAIWLGWKRKWVRLLVANLPRLRLTRTKVFVVAGFFWLASAGLVGANHTLLFTSAYHKYCLSSSRTVTVDDVRKCGGDRLYRYNLGPQAGDRYDPQGKDASLCVQLWLDKYVTRAEFRKPPAPPPKGCPVKSYAWHPAK